MSGRGGGEKKRETERCVLKEVLSEVMVRTIKLSPALSRDAEGREAGIWLMIGFSSGIQMESFKDGSLCCHNR